MPTISCESAVLYAFKIESGRPWYLLLRRAEGLSDGGMWETIEAVPTLGEPTARAAVRVLLQDTSLNPQALWAIERLETTFDPRLDSVRLRPIYVALVAGDVRRSAAYDTSRWFSEKEIANTLRSEQQRASIDEIHRTIGAVAARGQVAEPRLRLV